MVSVEVIDGTRMDLVREWGVPGVPTVVLNDRLTVEGPAREETLFDLFVHAADRSHPLPAAAAVPFRTCGRLDPS